MPNLQENDEAMRQVLTQAKVIAVVDRSSAGVGGKRSQRLGSHS
jgi:predicted CoA-binding protein